jgi:hypothetical protein
VQPVRALFIEARLFSLLKGKCKHSEQGLSNSLNPPLTSSSTIWNLLGRSLVSSNSPAFVLSLPYTHSPCHGAFRMRSQTPQQGPDRHATTTKSTFFPLKQPLNPSPSGSLHVCQWRLKDFSLILNRFSLSSNFVAYPFLLFSLFTTLVSK